MQLGYSSQLIFPTGMLHSHYKAGHHDLACQWRSPFPLEASIFPFSTSPVSLLHVACFNFFVTFLGLNPWDTLWLHNPFSVSLARPVIARETERPLFAWDKEQWMGTTWNKGWKSSFYNKEEEMYFRKTRLNFLNCKSLEKGEPHNSKMNWLPTINFEILQQG